MKLGIKLRSDWNWPRVAIIFATIALLIVVFRDGLDFLLVEWKREEYNHGFLIPFVAAYLLSLRSSMLREMQPKASWLGAGMIVLALVGAVAGRVSVVYIVIQYAFLLALAGLTVAAGGWRCLRVMSVPLICLIFMIPLPRFVYANLSAELQLISSELGVAVIQAFGISVFREGNVIDLGKYTLQVAEACSGLRYLFPLMSFGFICAALFKGPYWQRAVIFLSSFPITVLINSFRIGVIGILVENFGIEQAEGFLHDFEGWIVFMAGLALLVGEIWLFARLNGAKIRDALALEMPSPADFLETFRFRSVSWPYMVALGVLAVGSIGTVVANSREIQVPDGVSLAGFPLVVGDWRAKDRAIDQVYLDELRLDDYLLADYSNQSGTERVNLWVAYYGSQSGGKIIHSPRGCLPGGGWEIEEVERVELTGIRPEGQSMPVNRALIAQGDQKALVYYWFVQRGRYLTNEYLVKWWLFWDALTMGRTDGSLVRVTIPISDRTRVAEGDALAVRFIAAVEPQLSYFLPQENVPLVAIDSQ